MDISFLILNWWGLFGAIVWSLILGMFWYSPTVFFKIWQKAENITDEDLQNSNVAKSMIFGLIANSISVYVLVVVLNLTYTDSFISDIGVAALLSIGLITATEINNGAFRMTKPVVYLIDGGYRLLMMVGSALILTL